MGDFKLNIAHMSCAIRRFWQRNRTDKPHSDFKLNIARIHTPSDRLHQKLKEQKWNRLPVPMTEAHVSCASTVWNGVHLAARATYSGYTLNLDASEVCMPHTMVVPRHVGCPARTPYEAAYLC
jgi:hypothetical protein